MRTLAAVLVVCLGLTAGACGRRDNRETDRRAEGDSNSAAREAGRAAYKLSEESKKAARAAGRELRDASHEMHEGWKEQKQKEKEKPR